MVIDSYADISRFLLRFTGKEEEINLLGDGTEKAEFAEWSWMTPQEVIERVRISHLTDFILLIK